MKYTNIYPTPSEFTKGTNTCEYIVHHHTGTPEGTTQGVLNWLNKYQDYASCHYLINELWEVYKMWNDTDILWHAGTSFWDGKTNLNNYSIGIEIIWPLSNWGFTDIQREKFAELVKELCETHNLSKERIVRHKDISPWRKIDILDTFWNNEYSSYRDYIDSIFIEEDQSQRENNILRRRADETDVLINESIDILKKALKANKPNDYTS